MSHILICAMPNPGHVGPMLNIAQHLRKSGYTVTFYTAEVFRDQVESENLRFASLRGAANFDYRRPLDLSREVIHDGDDRRTPLLKTYFARTIPDQHVGLRQILHETPIDLVLVDTMFFGVYPTLLGPREDRPPFLGCGVNPMLLFSDDCELISPPDKTPLGRQHIREQNRQLQASFQSVQDCIDTMMSKCSAPSLPRPFFDCMYALPDRFLQFTSKSFEYPRSDMPDSIDFAGPLLPRVSASFEEPAWWHELDEGKPVVLVTQGTLANQDFDELIQPALRGLADEPLLVITATGRSGAEVVAAPSNVRIASFIPFERILPKIDALVTNGGYGAVNHAFSLGVPVVVAGDTEDKELVAARVAWTGAGLNLATRYPSSEEIRTAVRSILKETKYRHRAQQLREEFSRYNALNAVTQTVKELLAAHSPGGMSEAVGAASG